MYLFFGADKKQQNKITNDFITNVNVSLVNQFCNYCNKHPSTKVAFVPNANQSFTCNNCELKAVGNDFKNLGDKTLISNDKLSQTITKALINYQTTQAQSPKQVKQLENQVKTHIKTSNFSVQKIKGEMKILRITSENKLNEIVKASQTQNSSILFEELNKISKDRKPYVEEIVHLLCKKSLVNKKGLHFIDEESVQKMNSHVDERVNNLKSQVKIKLKEIDELTSWINSIEL